MRKVTTYQYWWNYGLKNQWKNNRTPIDILALEYQGFHSVQVLDANPILINTNQKTFDQKKVYYKLSKKVQDLPGLAEKIENNT